MISSVLVANRGEIACRIFDTCKANGIATIAVYSDADRRARHVQRADKAVRLGPSPAAESYLRGDLIIKAAQETGAEAIHPGYGFLSENADFAEAVLAAGLIWIGPRPDTIRRMGLKDEAKRIAEDAGVPVLPGYRGEDQRLETLSEAAAEIGFPLLIKAIAGGGGRGIREVRSLEALAGELESAQREAKSAFGDDRVMLERLVEQPRHIEVQVFGDAHGEVVHLFERDCSLQRRRQKVIEEAPAPGMTDAVRDAMTGAAVALSKSVGYEGAGTVEFIVDGTGPLTLDSFWFLEMNTRLQVEHPVTEMITGQDLVAWQLIVASGAPLPLTQDQITMDGHAIEARICAEDPANGFMPAAGRIELVLPATDDRLDAGFGTGDDVPPDYDSLIGKLIVHGADREEAIERTAEALAGFQLYGIRANTDFLYRCLGDERFQAGTHHVNLIAEAGERLTQVPDGLLELAASAVVRSDFGTLDHDYADPWDYGDGFRINGPARETVAMAIDGTLVHLDTEDGRIGVSERFARSFTEGPFTGLFSGGREGVTVLGNSFILSYPTFDDAVAALEAGDDVTAPMPGKILTVSVSMGDMVEKGQALAVMEAMKMEHTLAAPRDGEIADVAVAAGAQVAEGALLVALTPED